MGGDGVEAVEVERVLMEDCLIMLMMVVVVMMKYL